MVCHFSWCWYGQDVCGSGTSGTDRTFVLLVVLIQTIRLCFWCSRPNVCASGGSGSDETFVLLLLGADSTFVLLVLQTVQLCC